MPEAITYTEHPQDVLRAAVQRLDRGVKFALITSVAIKGGAAREVGSLAIVDQSGAMVGYMSNGCIDSDIRLRAIELLETGGPAICLQYGDGSPFKDLTLPCGGSLELLLDPDPDAQALRAALSSMQSRVDAELTFQCPKSDRAITFQYSPKPRLILAGRGAVFRATARVAFAAGFELHLLTPQEDDLSDLSDIECLSQSVLTTPNAIPDIAVDPHCGFLTLFHDHDWEPALLLRAVDSKARFIGCLGSTRTHSNRIEYLKSKGISPQNIARIHGPIGLVPSLRQAPLIAVSTMAQLAEAFPFSINVVEKSDKATVL
ncbi:hypothetical protein BVC71_08795 [Marivivens niveibacter]|uniref:Xanthine dehydrogenase n=1 Tax=Marivivens niveibacter TaxID=1930667 RepID=A0A251WWF5_9RHOB|nr:XdhC family protein [Marivivens niveibacter]OUD08810.1 hypothetical protein BVC71_08795 [Marivivens niveibacter]